MARRGGITLVLVSPKGGNYLDPRGELPWPQTLLKGGITMVLDKL